MGRIIHHYIAIAQSINSKSHTMSCTVTSRITKLQEQQQVILCMTTHPYNIQQAIMYIEFKLVSAVDCGKLDFIVFHHYYNTAGNQAPTAYCLCHRW